MHKMKKKVEPYIWLALLAQCLIKMVFKVRINKAFYGNLTFCNVELAIRKVNYIENCFVENET